MKILSRLLTLIFPPRCPFCGTVISNSELICPDCAAGLPLVDFQSAECCSRCGKYRSACICGKQRILFSSCTSVLEYSGKVKRGIDTLKRHSRSTAVDYMGTLMADAVRVRFGDAAFDFITAVPMNAEKEKERGHNQAKTLARHISVLLGISYLESPIGRLAGTPVQHSLSHLARLENSKQSYSICDYTSLSGRILLVDDVMTTGATVNRCAALLIELGASRVDVVSVATTMLHGTQS